MTWFLHIKKQTMDTWLVEYSSIFSLLLFTVATRISNILDGTDDTNLTLQHNGFRWFSSNRIYIIYWWLIDYVEGIFSGWIPTCVTISRLLIYRFCFFRRAMFRVVRSATCFDQPIRFDMHITLGSIDPPCAKIMPWIACIRFRDILYIDLENNSQCILHLAFRFHSKFHDRALFWLLRHAIH